VSALFAFLAAYLLFKKALPALVPNATAILGLMAVVSSLTLVSSSNVFNFTEAAGYIAFSLAISLIVF